MSPSVSSPTSSRPKPWWRFVVDGRASPGFGPRTQVRRLRLSHATTHCHLNHLRGERLDRLAERLVNWRHHAYRRHVEVGS